jgi:hypothetical protein
MGGCGQLLMHVSVPDVNSCMCLCKERGRGVCITQIGVVLTCLHGLGTALCVASAVLVLGTSCAWQLSALDI